MTKTPITWLGIAEIIEGSLFDNTPFVLCVINY